VPVSPDEILRKEFDQAMRGYDKDQVRAFLNSVAADYRAALKLGNYEAVGEEVGRILQTVNDSASALRQKATSEAEEILTKAEAESRDIRQAAQAEADNLRGQVQVEAQGLREHTDQQVRELIETAEKQVVELEAKVRKETEDKIREADARVQDLRDAEAELMDRLEQARKKVESVAKSLKTTPGPRLSSEDGKGAEALAAVEEESEPAGT